MQTNIIKSTKQIINPMKKLSILLGVGTVSALLLSFSAKKECVELVDSHGKFSNTTETFGLFDEVLSKDKSARDLCPEEIVLIDFEEEIELDFNTAEYLPIGFNVYAGTKLDLDNIVVEEMEEEIVLDFNTAEYLPIGFNAYAGMELDLDSIVVEEMEEEVVLDFNTAKYLPVGFNAYSGMELDLNDIKVEEMEEEIELGFEVEEYLPKGFNPYTK